MPIKIVVSNTVGIKVKGTINNEAGVPEPFDFGLTCKRLDVESIKTKIASEGDMIDFMLDVNIDWSGVKDEANQPVPYSAQAFRDLCKLPGVANISYTTFLLESGAKAKN